jgi:uncharacterized protein (TIRG00374 family)
MTAKRAFFGLVFVSALYLGALVWLDTRNHVFQNLSSIASALPVMLALALGSYLVRYGRWFWLLSRTGNRVSWGRGYLAYTAGFAFTVTPGKVGELVRIRYFLPMDVPASRVVSAFVMERACDLIAVLGMCIFIAQKPELLWKACAFVGIFLGLLILVALRPTVLSKLVQILCCFGLERIGSLVHTIQAGLIGCRAWLTAADISVCMASGFIAWAMTSYAFVVLLAKLGVTIPLLPAMSIYPLSMLVGAASMLPGGIGSTEAAIVTILAAFSVPLSTAIVCAVGIRFSSIWFAVVSGFAAMAVIERGLCTLGTSRRTHTMGMPNDMDNVTDSPGLQQSQPS